MTQSKRTNGKSIARSVANPGIRHQLAMSSLVWLLATAGIMLLSGCQSAPRQLIVIHQSKYENVDQTCDALKAAIEATGFSYKGTLNLNNSMAQHGVHLRRQVRVVQLGRAKYSKEMLIVHPEMCAFMPCRFGVYEDNDGHVYIASVNRTLITDMFRGTEAEVTAGHIAQDHADILRAVESHVTLLQD